MQNMNMMNVVFVTDENYALPTRTAIRAVMANAAGNDPLTVHVVCDDRVSAETERRFIALGTARATVRVLRVRNRYQEILSVRAHYTHATYLRFDLPRLLPELERVLYLDGDVIVQGDLRELYATPFGHCCVAAALDCLDSYAANYVQSQLFFSPNRYFNAGVLLMNLAAFRREGLTRQLVEFTQQRPWLMLQDQDALNVVLQGQVKYVGAEYNVMLPSYQQPRYQKLGGMANWKVLHFADNRKPWQSPAVYAGEVFMRYLAPEDWPECQYMLARDSYDKIVWVEWLAGELRRKLERKSWRSWFYEKQVDENGVKRKFKLFGISLFTKRKCRNRRMVRLLGFKFSWHTGYTLDQEPAGARYLDRAKAEKMTRQLRAPGVTRRQRERQLIVSLTSFPQRMADVHYCLYSLLTQKLKPNRVVLWLSPEEFPRFEADVPERVLRLREFGLELRWCQDNLKPYNKLVHSLEAFPDAVIVTADDDIYYPNDWLGKLYAAYLRRPEWIHCHLVDRVTVDEHGEPAPYPQWGQGHGTSMLNLLMGFCGVLYPPRVLHPDVTRRELFQKLCPTGDDLWFWAMAVLHGTLVSRIANYLPYYININQERHQLKNGEKTLMEENFLGGGNIRMFRALLAVYPALLPLLLKARATALTARPSV
ncbi:MAG: glycosyltransferase family 8 protein [Verrucomicrobiales bacterium]|nr:glycosyltransferase family 8 protein [Verrucomicrobiales bacterium]